MEEKLTAFEEENSRKIHHIEESYVRYDGLEEKRILAQEAKKRYEEQERAYQDELVKKTQNVEKKEKETGRQEKIVNESWKDWEKKGKEAREKVEAYERMYAAFLLEQAGFLAQKLEDGKPCPVCGAVHHPNPAEPSREAVTKEELDLAKEERQAAEEARENANHQYNENLTVRDECRAALAAAKQELAQLSGQQTVELAKQEWENCRREAELLAEGLSFKSRREAEQAAEQLKKEQAARRTEAEKARQEQLKLKEMLDQKQGQKEQKTILVQKRLTEQNEQKQKLQVTMEETGFTSVEEYRTAVLSQKEHDKLQDESRNYQDACKNGEGQVTALTDATRGKIRPDLAGQSEKLRTERGKLEQEDAVVKSLYFTANGRLAGSSKIDFETYVQRQYFRQIIGEANKRLLTMSGHQFMLKLKEDTDVGKKTNEGLDLSIYSLITDSERDVKTLSGGEAFLAALSMALGLSDIVGKNADMMFID